MRSLPLELLIDILLECAAENALGAHRAQQMGGIITAADLEGIAFGYYASARLLADNADWPLFRDWMGELVAVESRRVA